MELLQVDVFEGLELVVLKADGFDLAHFLKTVVEVIGGDYNMDWWIVIFLEIMIILFFLWEEVLETIRGMRKLFNLMESITLTTIVVSLFNFCLFIFTDVLIFNLISTISTSIQNLFLLTICLKHAHKLYPKSLSKYPLPYLHDFSPPSPPQLSPYHNSNHG